MSQAVRNFLINGLGQRTVGRGLDGGGRDHGWQRAKPASPLAM